MWPETGWGFLALDILKLYFVMLVCSSWVLTHVRGISFSFIKVYNERNMPDLFLAPSIQGVVGRLKTNHKNSWTSSWAFSLRRLGSLQPGKTAGEGRKAGAVAVHLAVGHSACPCY